VELSLGVTGRPAGGELAQRVAHAINRAFTRPATGWETQVGFEPGLLLRYRHAAILTRVGGTNGLGFDVAPAAGIAAGNILASADAGGIARFGWNLSHPWDPREWSGRRPLEAWVSAGGRGEYVARNMSLDGNLVHPTRHVDRVPGVWEYELGAGLRIQRLSLAYRAVTRGREYRTGPNRHTYSSMIAGIEVR
jgi:lipid A 3-O-deacylase